MNSDHIFVLIQQPIPVFPERMTIKCQPAPSQKQTA